MLKSSIKTSLTYGTKLLVSAGCILFVFQRYDLWGQLPHMLRQGQGELALAVGLGVGQIVFSALRWQSVLRCLQLVTPLWLTFRIFYFNAFVNSFLPAGLAGDAARIWLLRGNPRGLMTVVNSVVIDRIVVLLTLFIAAAVVQPFIWLQWGGTTMMVAVVGSALAMIAGTCAAVFVGPYIRFSRIAWVGPIVQSLSRDLRLLFLDRVAFSVTAAAAILSHLLRVAAAFSLAYGLGLGMSFVDWMVVMPIVLLVSAVPISLGGWGTREVTIVYMLGLFAIPVEQAVAVSIQYGLCMTLASLPGGALWITLRSQNRRPFP